MASILEFLKHISKCSGQCDSLWERRFLVFEDSCRAGLCPRGALEPTLDVFEFAALKIKLFRRLVLALIASVLA